MPQSYVSVYVHYVFGTKHRTSTITPDLEPRLYQYIGGILRPQGSRLIAAGGIPDHVHLLTSMSKVRDVAETARDIKANSSRWIHETFADQKKFDWQDGYGAFSVSYRDLESVKDYIRHQPEHHRTISFQEEFVALLKEHGIEYDERYLWV